MAPSSNEKLQQMWPTSIEQFDRIRRPKNTQSLISGPNRILVIAGIQCSVQGNLSWRYWDAMETSEDFIPVQSDYEPA
jgi:hypothetical protein